MELKKFHKVVEAINTYYAFALLLYATALYLASHSHLFMWVLIIATPALAAWSGFLLKSFLDSRNQRYGFRILSNVYTYEIGNNGKYTLKFLVRLKAGADHLMAFPIGYRWTGSGEESLPKLSSAGQQLLAPVKQQCKDESAQTEPYSLTDSTEGEWEYWFVAFNPPMHKGEETEVKYSQEFRDENGSAKPRINYFVRTPMRKLELNVKFPKSAMPTKVSGYYIKPNDTRRPYESKDVKFDADKQWATWTIERPKKGYCYRIQWQ